MNAIFRLKIMQQNYFFHFRLLAAAARKKICDCLKKMTCLTHGAGWGAAAPPARLVRLCQKGLERHMENGEREGNGREKRTRKWEESEGKGMRFAPRFIVQEQPLPCISSITDLYGMK